jgi:hypothetical protein
MEGRTMRIETNDWHQLMDHASGTIIEYVRDLRNRFPDMSDEAISRLALAAAVDFHGATLSIALRGLGDDVARAIDDATRVNAI